MAPPPSIRQLTRESLGDAVPGWFDIILGPLNVFFRQVVEAFTNGLTVSQNLAMAWVDVTVSEGEAVPPLLAPGLKGKAPRGVTVEGHTILSGTITAAPSITWARASVNDARGVSVPGVQISSVYGLGSGARVTLTLLIKAD